MVNQHFSSSQTPANVESIFRKSINQTQSTLSSLTPTSMEESL